MQINLTHLDVSQAGELADYEADGFTQADWLNDTAFRCDCCAKHFDDERDMDARFAEQQGVWVCETCAPTYRADMIADRAHVKLWERPSL